MNTFKQYITESAKEPDVWVDAEGKLVYIKGVPQSRRGGLNRWEWDEAMDMTTGSVTDNRTGITYHPPFRIDPDYFKRKNLKENANNNQTMTLWHGGNLSDGYNDTISHKSGKWEYGPGLYLTTHYDTARKYSKGSRKLYQLTIKQGNNIDDVRIPVDAAQEFLNNYAKVSSRTLLTDRLSKYIKDGTIGADIFLNSLINNDAIKPSFTNTLRKFLVDNGVDYSLVSSPFGWNEMMVVVFNMDTIINKRVITPKDKITEFDLPTEFGTYHENI